MFRKAKLDIFLSADILKSFPGTAGTVNEASRGLRVPDVGAGELLDLNLGIYDVFSQDEKRELKIPIWRESLMRGTKTEMWAF